MNTEANTPNDTPATSTSSKPFQLMTSLNEIKSFNPCDSGWFRILSSRDKITPDGELFPLTEGVDGCSIFDALWLIKKRRTEYQILVIFTRKCADRLAVTHPGSGWADTAYDAADADTAYDAAYAAYDAAYDAAYAAAYAAKRLLIEAITEYESSLKG